MGNPRCIVSGCPNDAVPGYEYCEKHGGKPKLGKGRPPKHSEIVSDLLREGCKGKEENRIIRELDSYGASLQELQITRNLYRKRIRDKEKEFYDAKKQGYDDADAGYPLTNEIRSLQTTLKKLNKWIKIKKLKDKQKYYAQETTEYEKSEDGIREHAVHRSEEDMNDGNWHDID